MRQVEVEAPPERIPAGPPHQLLLEHGHGWPEPTPELRGWAWLMERLGLNAAELVIMGTLLLVAFVLRFFSPLMPDGNSPLLITNCVQNTPVNAQNQTGTLCGLSYPFQRNYAQVGQPATPPNGQVFDEIYFAVFAHDDLKGISYIDPEPPLSKLIIASGEWLYGGFRAIFQGAQGNWADLGFNTFGWRIMSCIFGSLCLPMMYLFARQLWPNRIFAIAAATLVGFDGMFFIQSRIGMIDIFPIFLIMLSYTLFLVHLGSRSERESIVTLLLTGIACGLAIAAKWIALAATASIIFFLVARPLMRWVGLTVGEGERAWRWGLNRERSILPGGARAGLYVGTAALAFIAFPLVIYVASWFPFFLRGQFHSLGDLVRYNQWAYTYHATLTATHPYGSTWYSWPFLNRPVAYYYEATGLGVDTSSGSPLVAGMVDLGNPIIWWASIPAVLALPYFVLRHRSFPAAVILVGFITQYLPWARITRVIFLYHMFGGLIFMILALAFVLTRMQMAGPVEIHVFGDRMTLSTRFLVPGFLALAVLSFAFFYPVWTGLPLSDQAYLTGFPHGKMWLPSWI